MTRLLFALFISLAAPLRAQDVAGEFDYYVMSLSWSPNWCALEGDARGSPQCDDSADFGWVLHGLWPGLFSSDDLGCCCDWCSATTTLARRGFGLRMRGYFC